MKEIYKEYYDKLLTKNGKEKEIILCIEEMGELTQALSKYLRYKGIDKENCNLDNIREEIADVLNTVEQMQNIFGTSEIDKIRDEKFKRTFLF